MARPPGASVTLTPNSVVSLNSGETDSKPVLQVMDIRQIGTSQNVQERFRLILSDGSFTQQAMLATQLNELVKSGQLQKKTVVQLVEYICNTVQNRKIVIILNLEVITTLPDIIGDPKQIPSEQSAAANVNSVQPQQQHQQQPVSVPPSALLAQQPPMYGSGYRVGGPTATANNNYQNNGGGGAIPQASGQYQAPAANYQAPRTAVVNPPPMASSGSAGSFMQQRPYGRPLTAQSYQPPPMYSNRGPIARNEAAALIIPIAALNPYQGRWTIKARVTAKSELRRYNNAKGDGKVFSFDLLDAEAGEIRATCFNSVADQFFDRVEVGKVYLISKGSLKAAQKTFNHLKNEWEMFLESSSTVEPCFEEDVSIPQQHFDFRPISDIENMENNSTVDIIGVVIGIQPTTTIMRKNGTETQRRVLQIRDMSDKSVELTMWGAFCSKEGQQLQEYCDSGQFPVLAVKAGRISDFSGKTVGTISSTQLQIDPDIPHAHKLREWFDREGRNTSSLSISKEAGGGRSEVRKLITQIKDEGLGRAEKPDWISIRATIHFIKPENFCYTACPQLIGDRQCNKKVTNNGDGTWRCERCDKSFPECDYRYLLSLQVIDHTGATWLTAFQEAGEELFGMPAKDLYMWKQDENPRFGDMLQSLSFIQRVFKLKVKEDTYNDEARVRCTIVKAEKVDYAAESRHLIDLIGKLGRGEPISNPIVASSSLGGTYGVGSGVYGTSTSAAPAMATTYGGTSSSALRGTSYGYGNSDGGYAGDTNQYSGRGRNCYKCGKEGHFAQECPENGRNDGYGGMANVGAAASSNCYKCGQGGHWARDCPSQGGANVNKVGAYGTYDAGAAGRRGGYGGGF